jgi:hypothetical protein
MFVKAGDYPKALNCCSYYFSTLLRGKSASELRHTLLADFKVDPALVNSEEYCKMF